ncbi:hypothetical protein [Kingella potus]|nr:hypothetical protein [Kingella potus]
MTEVRNLLRVRPIQASPYRRPSEKRFAVMRQAESGKTEAFVRIA